jgi:hypothetical protein
MNKTVCLAVGFQILAMAACETPVAEQGHPCPCAPQWTCCSANLCVPDGTSCPAADSGASPVASDLDANTIDSSADLDAEEYSTSPCKPGVYQGSFTGSYSSHLVLGMPLAVSGNVDLTLDQEGTANQMCTIMVQGEGVITEHCNDVFTVSGGTITGMANGIDDAGTFGYPFYCTMTGTLDCANQILDNGWIQCTYCAAGVIQYDGGAVSGDPLATCEGAGGNFAGVLQANYDTSTLSFTDGVWNGAEDLCTGIGGTSTASCNNGGSPGPEGGPATNYLQPADGGYGVAPNYGGAGSWSTSCLDCEHD